MSLVSELSKPKAKVSKKGGKKGEKAKAKDKSSKIGSSPFSNILDEDEKDRLSSAQPSFASD
jgi:hypothetical protein